MRAVHKLGSRRGFQLRFVRADETSGFGVWKWSAEKRIMIVEHTIVESGALWSIRDTGIEDTGA